MTNSSERPSRLELWGGIDSTRNRVGDRCLDQLELTGHYARLSDLDLFANLGLSAIRYPVLWEHTAGQGLEMADWTWADERLTRLKELGIRPIVGLLHHGNGPEGMTLLHPHFPGGLAEYAHAVAERFPWIDGYTPVNEPLTTARFSGLYGLWYPHARDRFTFCRILLAQCKATCLSMDAIRGINPDAQLIQTEDLGTIYSTPALSYQAEYENERRWLTWDILCGHFNQDHPLWSWFLEAGTPQADLEWFLEHPCPPAVIGIDHYLSSDRFQDEHVERYPDTHVGNTGRHDYIDILAPRARAEEPDGADVLLSAVWERYGLPVALTETHNGCTREEQMRWFVESWQGAERARAGGVDVRAVTAWSLLGVHGWDALATGEGRYETGVFDIRSPRPRPTAMVKVLQDLAGGEGAQHHLLSVPGWWRRPVRFAYGVAVSADGATRTIDPLAQSMDRWPTHHPLLIAGSAGRLGRAFARICDLRGIPYRALSRAEMDIADPHSVALALEAIDPWAVVNAAGYAQVDGAEGERALCRRENLTGPEILARACAKHGAQLLTFSSENVFNGRKGSPYVEGDRVGPLNVYGRAQAAAERRVLNRLPSALVVRTSALFGPWDSRGFLAAAMRALRRGEQFLAASDQVVSPTYIPDLVNACLDLLIDEEAGIWHLTNEGEVTWADLAIQAAKFLALPSSLVLSGAATDLPALRPAYSALISERGQLLPPLDDALNRYVAEYVPSPELALTPS